MGNDEMPVPEEHEIRTTARGGGRPTRVEAALLRDKILDVATEIFLKEGFGATSVEAVVARARISKRTFYHRFTDKANLFEAVVRRLIEQWMTPIEAELVEHQVPLEEVLRHLAQRMLAAALSPEALALYRILIAEAQRFPELARIMDEQGAARGIARIAALLAHEAKAGRLAVGDPTFAAEQLISLVVAAPRRRALGFGEPLRRGELEAWARRSVALFLDGCRVAAQEEARS